MFTLVPESYKNVPKNQHKTTPLLEKQAEQWLCLLGNCPMQPLRQASYPPPQLCCSDDKLIIVHTLWLLAYFTYLLSPAWEGKLHAGRNICLFYSLSYPLHQERWMNEWMRPGHDHHLNAHTSAAKGNVETIRNDPLRLMLLLMFQFWYIKAHKIICLF